MMSLTHSDENHQAGTALFLAGKYDEAAQRFAAAISSNPCAEFWNDWATAHAAAGHLPEALEGYRHAQRLEPENTDVSANLAVLQRNLEIRKQQPVGADLQNIHHTATTLLGLEQREAAATLLRELLCLQESPQPWLDLGGIHLASGHLLATEVCYRRAAELDSPGAIANIRLHLLLTALSPKAEASPFQASLPADPLLRAQFIAALVEDLKRYIAILPPESPEAPPEIARALAINHADSSWFAMQSYRLLEAVPDACRAEVFAEIAGLCSKDYRLFLGFAEYFLKHGDYEKALLLAQTAADSNPLDLHADRLLDRCTQRRNGNENATAEFLKTHFCPRPWQHFEIQESRDVYLCCSAYLPVPIGKIGEGTAEEIWNSPVAQEIRASILDGSYRYCSRVHCPVISGRNLPPRELVQINGTNAANLTPRSIKTPEDIYLTYDKTCNLACPQCRPGFIYASAEQRQEMDSYVPTILELARNAKVLYMDGAGEVFASKHMRGLLKQVTRANFPDLKFDIISNGQLFDRRTYEEFDLRGRIKDIRISIDAARPETYAIVRRGGKFDRLMANLQFLDDLRLYEGETFRIELRYVVSGWNYREMPEFVRIGKSIHANGIYFTRFRNWHTLPANLFQAMNITDPAHPEYADFLRVLQAPELADPIVDLGSVRPFIAAEHGATLASAEQPTPTLA